MYTDREKHEHVHSQAACRLYIHVLCSTPTCMYTEGSIKLLAYAKPGIQIGLPIFKDKTIMDMGKVIMSQTEIIQEDLYL